MAATPSAHPQHMPLARSEPLAEDARCEGLEEGFEEGPEESPGSEVSRGLGRMASRRTGALCAAAVLGAIVVVRGTGVPSRLAAAKDPNPKIISAEAEDCSGCDQEYSKGSGVIADPTALGGAMTFEDVQKALHATCPESCTRKTKGKAGLDVFRGFGGSGDGEDEDEWGQVGGQIMEELEPDDGTPCHTAASGEMCYDLVTYTVRKLLTNSDFYPGLTPESTEAEVQRRLHEDRPGICHRPCVDDEEDGHTSKADASKGEGGGDDGECKNAEPGDDCFGTILWVLNEGVFKHPKWFLGLNQASSMEAVQRHLHKNPEKGMPPSCPEPCEEKCRDAFEGEPCFDAVTWAMDVGISNHSEWFPGLNKASKFAEVQMHFHSNPNATVYCPKPCNVCHTAIEGEKCYSAVKWVLSEGIVKHPESYKGLTRLSSFQEVQDHLHRNKSESKSKCVKPCPVAQEGAPLRLLMDKIEPAPAAVDAVTE